MIRWSLRRGNLGPRSDRFWDIVFGCVLAIGGVVAAFPISFLKNAPYWLSYWIVVCVAGGLPIALMLRDPGLKRAAQRLGWSIACCIAVALIGGVAGRLAALMR